MLHLPLLPFWISLFTCLLTTPLVRKLALRTGAMVNPTTRSVHERPVPHLGSLGIFAGCVLGTYFAWNTGWFSKGGGVISPSQLKVVFSGAALIMVLGIVDDIKALSPGVKFAGQFAVALLTAMLGVRIEFITNPFGGFVLMGSAAVPATVLWIVSVVNVVNLIDGLDGLAAGIIAIASFSLLVVALISGQPSVVAATAVLTGSTLGFLPYNFNPARIFMGDAGAMLLGYMAACVAVLGTMKSAAAIALTIPCLALGLPIFDTAYAIVRRAASGRPIYEADRAHIHHRLLEKGWSQRRVVLSLYAVSIVLGLGSIALARLGPKRGAIAVALSVAGLALAGRHLGVFGHRERSTAGRSESGIR